LNPREVEQLELDYEADIVKLFSVNELMKAIERSEIDGIITDDYGDLVKDLDLIEKAREKK